ncbi:hypothetical protein PENTCL1PPCAC_12370, partial [Pristionchus entomophagus]
KYSENMKLLLLTLITIPAASALDCYVGEGVSGLAGVFIPEQCIAGSQFCYTHNIYNLGLQTQIKGCDPLTICKGVGTFDYA